MLTEKAKHTYVLDTSVLIHSPYAFRAFDDNDVVIPYSVLLKTGEYAKSTGEVSANAREFNRLVDEAIRGGKSLTGWVYLENGGRLSIVGTKSDSIFDVAEEVNGTIVSRDVNQRLDANCRGIPAEEYKTEQVTNGSRGYTGRRILYVSPTEIDAFKQDGFLKLIDSGKHYATKEDGTIIENATDICCNEFVTLVNSSNPSGGTLLGRFDGKKIVKLCLSGKSVFGITPRNVGQRFALEALMAPADIAPLVILKGPAGTAKTFLAMAAGLENAYNNHNYRRILVSRPNTKFDDDIGYLTGGEAEKISPLLRGLFDNIENLMPNRETNKDGKEAGSPVEILMSTGVIVAQAMAYMRGRSITDTYVVVDEAQNATPNQILGLITRIGEGSKIVLLGDAHQIDHPHLDHRNNGLSYAAEHMKGSSLCWQLTFSDSECTRSALASEAIARLTPKGA